MCNSDRIMNANMTDSDIKTEDVVQEEQIETTQILAPLAIEKFRKNCGNHTMLKTKYVKKYDFNRNMFEGNKRTY